MIKMIIQVNKEIIKNLNNYILRNQINYKFFVKENIKFSIIIIIIKSFISQSIILTIMFDFSTDFLLQKKIVWENIFFNIAQKIKKNTH